jgi:small subunit ribosomal protein S11
MAEQSGQSIRRSKTTDRRQSRRQESCIRKGVTRGIAHIKATFNNTMVTITDTSGETLAWASRWHRRLQGARKSTSFAAGQRCRTGAPSTPASTA